jgi:hypothetical protein
MEWKLQREDHNRQDKKWKPDYREALAGESQRKSTPQHLERFREESAHKQDLIRRYQAGRYHLSSCWLCLDWTLDTFASRNKLDPNSSETRQIFTRHRRAAERDFEAIRTAVRAAAVTCGYYDCEWQPRAEFRVRLSCDIVAPERGELEGYPRPLFKAAA